METTLTDYFQLLLENKTSVLILSYYGYLDEINWVMQKLSDNTKSFFSESEVDYLLKCKKRVISFSYYQNELSKYFSNINILRFFELTAELSHNLEVKEFKNLCLKLLKNELVNNKINRTIKDPFDKSQKCNPFLKIQIIKVRMKEIVEHLESEPLEVEELQKELNSLKGILEDLKSS